MTTGRGGARKVFPRCVAAFVWLSAAGVIASADGGPPLALLAMQPFRESQTIALRAVRGSEATATLVNLNPAIGAWYLLTVDDGNRLAARTYHLENPRPRTRALRLDPQRPALLIAEGSITHRCELFDPASPDRLEGGGGARTIFQPLCGSRLYVRNPAVGRHTRIETMADFLRERVPGGESLLALGHHVVGDRNLETGKVGTTFSLDRTDAEPQTGPAPALADAAFTGRAITSENLGISVADAGGGLVPGAWYKATGNPGVWVSVLQPRMIAAPVLHGHEKSVNALDPVEASALCYLIAFDLDRFELAYAGGTENPSVEWSAHMPARLRDDRLPGPDGIGTIAPLVPTGLLSPDDAGRVVATFTGGFKRAHGAFLYGELSTKNQGSHYGFIENGTVLSTLQPGLATIVVRADGRVDMKTWTEADNAKLRDVRYARQNGVAIVEVDEPSQMIAPGRLVNQWGPGNWSGSEDRKLRTIRAAVAIQEHHDRRFLVYAVFSSATPSAMARVFQAYQCRYALLLDMNALEHTYLALHRRDGSRLVVEHLIKGMSQLDRAVNGVVVPRFVGYPDNRDFFSVLRRNREGLP